MVIEPDQIKEAWLKLEDMEQDELEFKYQSRLLKNPSSLEELQKKNATALKDLKEQADYLRNKEEYDNY